MRRFESTEGLNTASNDGDHLSPSIPSHNPILVVLKRTIDICGALLFIVLGWPIYVAVALGVKFTSPGPIHFCQMRIGKDGKEFPFFKFRSMEIDAEEKLNQYLNTNPDALQEWDKFQKLVHDPRITPFGTFIRRTSLDELPQFWNVLIGDMSLVGPRPVTKAEKHRYGNHWPLYCSVRPGLTGLWQVSGRSTIAYEQRVRLDAKYVADWTIGLDLKILMKTVVVVFLHKGAS